MGDQVQNLPSQQSLPLPKVSPRPFSNQHQQQEITIPQTLPGPQGGDTKELPLPQVFRGCWRGLVERVDSIVMLDPREGRPIWLTKSYVLCYKQTGYNGKWILTFAEGAVADRGEVTDQRQSIKVKSVSGPDQADLTAYLHFRAPLISLFGMSAGVANTLDELAHLQCVVTPDKSAMQVRAAVFVETNNRPTANIYWHTRFQRTASQGPG